MSKDGAIFEEWRVADRRARALELYLAKASTAFLQGTAPPPVAWENARKLREVSTHLFALAMQLIEERAKTGGH
jgi:hypothetical protein